MDPVQKAVVRRRYRRISWALAGLVCFIWIGLDDRTTRTVITVAIGLVIAIVLTLYDRFVGQMSPSRHPSLWVTAGVGVLSGLLVPFTTVILMLVKVSLHSHDLPEFTIDDVTAVLLRTPIWTVAGLLIGAAIGLMSCRSGSNRT